MPVAAITRECLAMFRSGRPESSRWVGTSSVRMFRTNGPGLFDDMVDDAVFALAQMGSVEVPQTGYRKVQPNLLITRLLRKLYFATTMTLLRITLAAIAGSAIVTIAALSLSLQGRFNSRSLL